MHVAISATLMTPVVETAHSFIRFRYPPIRHLRRTTFLRQINAASRTYGSVNNKQPALVRNAMPSFDVRFIKTVCDDTGHEHRACQAAFKVDAASLSVAAQLAETDFCRQKGVRDWTIFADSMELRTPPAFSSAWGG